MRHAILEDTEMLDELKNAKKVIGLNQTIKAIEEQTAVKVFIAEDAEQKVINQIMKHCNDFETPVEKVESMKLLGKACGIDVKAATACIIVK